MINHKNSIKYSLVLQTIILASTHVTVHAMNLPAAMQPEVTTPLATTPSCNSQEKLLVVVHNPTANAVRGLATYKLNVNPNIRLNPSPNPNVEFTIPAQSFNTIICLDKDKKGSKRLGELNSVSFIINKKRITKTFEELKQGSITLRQENHFFK